MKQSTFKKTFVLLLLLLFSFSCLISTFPSEPTQTVEAQTEVTNNFLSRNTVYYENINGKTVAVDSLYRYMGEKLNNPNVAQGIMIKQSIDYKKKYPEKEVYVTLTSFHLSVVASVCLDEESPNYGRMKSLYDAEYDDEGYYRISYLLVEAARYGINVIVIGQIDAGSVLQESGYVSDINHTTYFKSHLEDDCYEEGKKVKDYMVAKTTDWTSYGDKPGSDMMHLKSCTVSNYIDSNGVEHGSAVWLSSTNLDGIDMNECNGLNMIQTGVVISDHEDLRRVVYNYTKLMSQYCGQEEINIFRDKVIKMNTEQTKLINAGKSNQIASDEQIVYLGTENDKVFEMYFSPFGGDTENWDTEMNPFSKYITKLLPSISGGNHIEIMWNNVKFVSNFAFAKTVEDIIQYSFANNVNLNNILYLNVGDIDASKFSSFVEGENIGVCSINEFRHYGYHTKDLQLSYVEDGQRYYISLLNSLNFHAGAMFGQSNSVLVIKESESTGNSFYSNFKDLTVPI